MTVHFMEYGMTACMMPVPPGDWPKGHKWSGDWKDVTCLTCLAGKNIAPTFKLSEDGKSITCLRCGLTSHNPSDVAEHFCGKCCAYHDDIWPHARKWWVEHPDFPRLNPNPKWPSDPAHNPKE